MERRLNLILLDSTIFYKNNLQTCKVPNINMICTFFLKALVLCYPLCLNSTFLSLIDAESLGASGWPFSIGVGCTN
ncbi:hypothetical protein LV92_02325 [Arenibacter echinorum]|uniref:Uncharacterized protein n=1 Tax=Arenibacter echinorum TaxID=440515 RepID=A0A327RBV5_9FLAO|nr:hypothetical protein LV92_02325 [Arenibacter echinorum]